MLCPGGVIQFDMTEYKQPDIEIYAAEYKVAEQGEDRELKKILKTEEDYNCPDGSYYIELDCPLKSKSLNKQNIEPGSFHPCPFCVSKTHQYRFISPSEPGVGDIGGNCGENEKQTRFAVEFINDKDDYMSCCVKTHS